MAELYRKKKELFDNIVYQVLVKRLTEPVQETDAFGMGHVDEVGNETNDQEDWSYTKLDKLIFDIRSLLGKNIGSVVKDSFEGVDLMKLMSKPVVKDDYLNKFSPVLKLVEETSYLPDAYRGQAGGAQKEVESGMTMEQRISFALTVATAIMSSMLKDRIVSDSEFDEDVLLKTEGTFGVRSIGDYKEVIGYLRTAGLSNGREITNEGLRLAARLAKVFADNGLVSDRGGGINNQGGSWLEISHVG